MPLFASSSSLCLLLLLLLLPLVRSLQVGFWIASRGIELGQLTAGFRGEHKRVTSRVQLLPLRKISRSNCVTGTKQVPRSNVHLDTLLLSVLMIIKQITECNLIHMNCLLPYVHTETCSL